MFLIEVFVNFLTLSFVGAFKPNVYITFLNITEADRFTKIVYTFNVQKGASLPLNLDKYVDILTVDYYSREQKSIFTRKILFNDKKTGFLLNEFSLMLETGNNGTVKSIIKFRIQRSFEIIFGCWKKTDSNFYGKLYIINAKLIEDLPKEPELYLRIDAYFTICNKKDQDFETLCEGDVDFCHDNNIAYLIVIFMVGGFVLATNFIKLFVILISRSRRSSNRVSPLRPTR
ncbi:hypothetical protein ACKWTF_008197 [Chironomus riparius]